MSHRSDFVACSCRINIYKPAVWFNESVPSAVIRVRFPTYPISTAMSDSKSLNAPFLEVKMSVSNRSNLPGRFGFRLHPNPDRGNVSYHTKNLAHCKSADFITNNLASPHRNIASKIKNLRSDGIMTWSVRTLCISSRSLTPDLRYSNWPIFVESLSKTHKFRSTLALFSQLLNKYQLDCKLKCLRCKSGQTCTIYVLIISRYDANSTT